MNYLMDTHAFLWWITESINLSAQVIKIIENPENEIFFSAVSGWEIIIKANLKRLELREDPKKLIPAEIQKNAFTVLPIHLHHVLHVHSLENWHSDPFDRLLVSQAMQEHLVLLTKDKILKKYEIETVW